MHEGHSQTHIRADEASQDTVGTMAAVNYVNGLIEEEVRLAGNRC